MACKEQAGEKTAWSTTSLEPCADLWVRGETVSHKPKPGRSNILVPVATTLNAHFHSQTSASAWWCRWRRKHLPMPPRSVQLSPISIFDHVLSSTNELAGPAEPSWGLGNAMYCTCTTCSSP
jgi:hypothetical protein